MRKTILITGASAGIGHALALAFARRGYHLALAARRLDSLQALKDQLAISHPALRVDIAALDVTQLDTVAPAIEAFAARCGEIDIIVANAGVGDGSGLIGTPRAEATDEIATTCPRFCRRNSATAAWMVAIAPSTLV